MSEISWHGSYDDALAQAKAETKPVLLYLWAPG
jgi:hypothetical protein